MSAFDYSKDMFGAFTPADGGFYVYILLRPDNSPLYVGKGMGDRMYQHEKEAKKGHNCYKCRAIREIWESGGQIGRVIIFKTNSEHAAFKVEAETIARFRNSVINVVNGDPFNNRNPVQAPRPVRMTKAYRQARKERIITLLERRERQAKNRLRYLRFGGSEDERRELEEEVAKLYQMIRELEIPPLQHEIWQEETL